MPPVEIEGPLTGLSSTRASVGDGEVAGLEAVGLLLLMGNGVVLLEGLLAVGDDRDIGTVVVMITVLVEAGADEQLSPSSGSQPPPRRRATLWLEEDN
jgi:hypothetical protein